MYNNKKETSLYNKVDIQKKLLLSILDTVRRLESKSRVFRYSARECRSRYGRPDNLLQHIRSLNNNKHKHVTSKIKSRFCSRCDKILSRQYNYTRYMRSKYSDINLGAWKRQQYVLLLWLLSLSYLYRDRDYTLLSSKQLLKIDTTTVLIYRDLLESLYPAIENQEDILDIDVLSTLQNSRHQIVSYRQEIYSVFYSNCFFSVLSEEFFRNIFCKTWKKVSLIE